MNQKAQHRVLAATVAANVPTILWSAPGEGKSAFIESTFPAQGYAVETVIAAHRDPADFNGLPIVEGREVYLAAPAWVTRLNDAEKGVLFLDEFSQAPPSVQGACLRMLNERFVGETRLGEDVRIVLAANPASSAAGGYDLDPPTANRMCHLDWVGADAEAYALGLSAGWGALDGDGEGLIVEPAAERVAMVRALIGGYLQANPAALRGLPDDPESAGRGWASPRSWEMLAKALPFLREDDLEAQVLLATGCIGEGAGVAFATWLKDMDLPDPRDVMADPGSFDWASDRVDRVFVVASSIATAVAAAGTREAYDQAMVCVEACSDAGRSDIAITLAYRVLEFGKTHRWLPEAKTLSAALPGLQAAGLMPAAA